MGPIPKYLSCLGTLFVFFLMESFWDFGTFAVWIFWGIGLAFHAFGVFGQNILFGKDWEERKMKEFMDDDKQHWE